MKIVITGGSGFIGGPLIRYFLAEKHIVRLLTRQPERTQARMPPSVQVEPWDGKNLGPWAQSLHEADAVINLAGESVANKRWSPQQKQTILSSRIDATKVLAQAIQQAAKKPALFINASAVGYYGSVAEGSLTETSSRGQGFLAETCVQWEQEALRIQALGVRVVRLRIGVVLEKGGGALQKMLPPFQAFIGGPLGSGRQWVSWIHRDDLIGMMGYILTHPSIEGAVNATAPTPVRMKEFCQTLGVVINRPSSAPVPALVLRLMVGEMADEMLLSGQCVLPRQMESAGYVFRYPELQTALEAILGR